MTNKHRAPEPDATDTVTVQLSDLGAADRAAFERIATAEGVDLGQVIVDYAIRGLHGRANVNNGTAGNLVQAHTVVGGLTFS